MCETGNGNAASRQRVKWTDWRGIWRRQSQTLRSWEATPAAVAVRAVGVSQVEDRVLRLPRKFVWIGLFNIGFFGSGGWFWALQNIGGLQQGDVRSWMYLCGYGVFVVLGVLILWKCQRRISFGVASLTDKRFLRAPRQVAFAELTELRFFHTGKPRSGFVMGFPNGVVVRIPASFEGFGAFASVLSGYHPLAQLAIAAKKPAEVKL